MVRCSKGLHYYDENKFMFCPYCGIYDDDENKTIAMNSNEIEKMPKEEQDTSGNKKMGFFWNHKKNADVTAEMTSEENPDDVKTMSGVGLSNNDYVAGWLVCTKGEDKGRDYRIYKGNNFLGRDYGMDIRIENDSSISRKNHCSIIYEPMQSKFYIKPMENIIYVNGEMLDGSMELKSGQKLEIGNSEFVFIAFCGEERKWEE